MDRSQFSKLPLSQAEGFDAVAHGFVLMTPSDNWSAVPPHDGTLQIIISPLARGKAPVGAESSAGAVGRYNAEMIRSVRSQAADVRSDVSVRAPTLTLHRRSVSITGRRAILERNACGQPMRIK